MFPLPHPYRGREVSLATRHGKERAIGRPFHVALGWRLRAAEAFDTDSLGTFSGEIPRPAAPAETCRIKAERGLDCTGLALGLASEGSFGPHPLVPFLSAGREWMTFVDRATGLVIEETLLARRTNFSHHLSSASPRAGQLEAWLARIGFPAPAVLVRPHRPVGEGRVEKGLRDPARVRQALAAAAAASADGQALLETDMRAHMNPTRMAEIRRLAFRLARRIATACPACSSPGWGRVDTIAGLPCAWCGTATQRTLLEVFGCPACSHRQERPRADGLREANPGQCPFCNP
jgi:hypothetical protein